MKRTRFYSVFMLACLLLCVTALHAQEPYAVLSDDNTVLTFYYDTQKAGRNGMSVGPFASQKDRGWNDSYRLIKTVVFDSSFANCTSITSTARWFKELRKLETIIGIENLNTVNVTDMSAMFEECTILTSLDVSNFNTVNVTDMSDLFAGCESLTSLDVSNFNTAKVTSMSGVFAGCEGLTSLDVSNFNTAKVTRMHNLFAGCKGLTSLDVSNFNTVRVTDMRYMFSGCSSLTTLDLSSFKTSNVTSMNSMFSGCSGLTTIYAADGWNTEKVKDGSHMFYDCVELIGEEGTIYDKSHTDYTYARFDGGAEAPGYLTYKDTEATAISGLNVNTNVGDDKAPVYNLGGQRMTTAANGIFIKNGRKFVMK